MAAISPKIEGPHIPTLWLPNQRDYGTERWGKPAEHGIYAQIPTRHSGKSVVSIHRNIFERYVSLYEYKHWQKAPWVPQETLEAEFPDYPNLSFEDFMALQMAHTPFANHPWRQGSTVALGATSLQFVLFYAKDPKQFFAELKGPDAVTDDWLKEQMAPVHFLDNNSLNQSLYDYMAGQGYDKEALGFILEEGRQNVSRPKDKTWQDYYSPTLMQKVQEWEWLYFRLMPLMGIAQGDQPEQTAL